MKRSLNILCANCLFTPLPNTTVCECMSCGVLYCDECLTKDFHCVVCQKRNIKVSKLASRIIGNKLVSCEFCYKNNIPYKTLMNHSAVCESWKFECNQLGCNFKGNNSQFLTHINESHFDQVMNLFDANSKLNQNLIVTLNNTSNTQFFKGAINESKTYLQYNDLSKNEFSNINNPYSNTSNSFSYNNSNNNNPYLSSSHINSTNSSNNIAMSYVEDKTKNNDNMASSSFSKKSKNGNDKDCLIF